jgi:hypothetical protein
MNKFDKAPPSMKQDVSKTETESKFAVEYPDERNIVDDTKAEIKMLKNAFKSQLDRENELKKKNINPNFWFAVYFQDEEQKEARLK